MEITYLDKNVVSVCKRHHRLVIFRHPTGSSAVRPASGASSPHHHRAVGVTGGDCPRLRPQGVTLHAHLFHHCSFSVFPYGFVHALAP